MNFLSSGNQFTEIILDKSKSTLIVGENGAGKSTILDALSFALYGKAFRNINKPQLVNSITGKNCVVECEFDVGGKQYLIRRGMKPYFFEIYQNKKLINQDSKVTEYQEVLEKQILKLTHKSFSQIVVLGSANFVPFMQLPPYIRREVIEDLLDIQIFSIMNSLLKSKIDENKADISSVEQSIFVLENQIELQKKHISSIRQNNDEIVEKKRQSIEKVNQQIQEATIELQSLNEDLQRHMDSIDDKTAMQKKLQKTLDVEKQIDDKIKSVRKELKFYQDNDNCPTCRQTLEESFKTKKVAKKTEQIDKLVDGSSQLEKEISNLNQRINDINKIQKHIDTINKQIQTINNNIFFWNGNITLLNNEIESVRKNTKIIDGTKDEVKKLKEKLKTESTFKEQLYDKRNLINVSSYLLKDNGVKTKIIKQYVPIMNKLINKYLAALDFFVQFELNEKFEETIKSRFRDEFSYNSFSEGEKSRLDLALLFTWRAIAKMRNSASTNLLIMDEVFDSSLDDAGSENLLQSFQNFINDANLFVISHKGDKLYDSFHSVIKFKKEKSFSRMIVEKNS
jgi:DNA repair exonuclease SbcCD ATPase subunit